MRRRVDVNKSADERGRGDGDISGHDRRDIAEDQS